MASASVHQDLMTDEKLSRIDDATLFSKRVAVFCEIYYDILEISVIFLPHECDMIETFGNLARSCFFDFLRT